MNSNIPLPHCYLTVSDSTLTESMIILSQTFINVCSTKYLYFINICLNECYFIHNYDSFLLTR